MRGERHVDIEPLVGVVMGSDSDLPVVKDCLLILEELGIAAEARIMSAHRTPILVMEYATQAEKRGLKVLIAAAGGAAHLGGVLAAHTLLPVIGLPILGHSLAGMDALFSMVQMPPGIPVATVGVNNGRNAGLLAAQILGASDPKIKERLLAYRQSLAQSVSEKDRRLQNGGFREY